MRLLDFWQDAAQNLRTTGLGTPETFNFLGFTHIYGKKGSNGMRRVLRRNRGKRLQAKLMDLKNDLQRRSHPTKMTAERLKRLIYHWIPVNHTYPSPPILCGDLVLFPEERPQWVGSVRWDPEGGVQ